VSKTIATFEAIPGWSFRNTRLFWAFMVLPGKDGRPRPPVCRTSDNISCRLAWELERLLDRVGVLGLVLEPTLAGLLLLAVSFGACVFKHDFNERGRQNVCD
tara:strand:- start:448 stop:753 length:306 start_codon:yes stop_codon:yes gene_type:complete